MEYESQGYTISDKCPRNNTHKDKKLVNPLSASVAVQINSLVSM